MGFFFLISKPWNTLTCRQLLEGKMKVHFKHLDCCFYSGLLRKSNFNWFRAEEFLPCCCLGEAKERVRSGWTSRGAAVPAAAAGSGFGLIRQGCSSASAAQEPPHPCIHSRQGCSLPISRQGTHLGQWRVRYQMWKDKCLLPIFTVRLVAPHKYIQSQKTETRFTSSEPRVDYTMRHIYVA